MNWRKPPNALRRHEEIQVTVPGGKVASAKLVGRDHATDLAVLKCGDATTAAVLGDSLSLKVGNVALVVGRTRVSGPVAALAFVSLAVEERRLWGGTALAPYVRLDVALQRTGVGGAVVDANGRIVGVATPRFSPGGAVALPVATVNRVVDVLLEKGRIPRGYLGEIHARARVGLTLPAPSNANNSAVNRKTVDAAQIACITKRTA